MNNIIHNEEVIHLMVHNQILYKKNLMDWKTYQEENKNFYFHNFKQYCSDKYLKIKNVDKYFLKIQ